MYHARKKVLKRKRKNWIYRLPCSRWSWWDVENSSRRWGSTLIRYVIMLLILSIWKKKKILMVLILVSPNYLGRWRIFRKYRRSLILPTYQYDWKMYSDFKTFCFTNFIYNYVWDEIFLSATDYWSSGEWYESVLKVYDD